MLPTPRYAIGDAVWFPQTTHTTEQLPCPDCLGTREWKVTTPAGTELSTACLRCTRSGYLRTPGGEDIPSLSVRKYIPTAMRLTIGSVRIDTASERAPIEYMCRETGIGSGSIYDERKLFPTEEEAFATATLWAAESSEKLAAEPSQIKTRELGSITVKIAGRMADWHAVYDAWDVARWHRETLDSITDTSDPSINQNVEEVREYIEQRASDLRRYEFIDRHLFEALLAAARQSDDPAVRDAVGKIDHTFPSGDGVVAEEVAAL